MPFRAGGHAAAGGSFTLLRLPEPELPDIVYLEQLTSAVFPDRPGDIDRYLQIMNCLVTEAEPLTESRGMIQRILEET